MGGKNKLKGFEVSEQKYGKLQDEYREAVTAVTEQKALIAQLEEDLRSVNALSSLFRGDAEGEAVPKNYGTETVTEIVNEVYPTQGSAHEGGKSAADSLLPIVQSQRERYRVRAQELEAQNLSQQQQITMLTNEIDKLRSDNIKLYEKIRFLQSYPAKGGASPEDPTESHYHSQYEQRLDPFSSFSKKERVRRYMELKPYDKITLNMGRFILGNRTARIVTFVYTILLHLLVFLVLYKVAHTESCKRDVSVDCHEKFAEHMLKAHGHKDFKSE